MYSLISDSGAGERGRGPWRVALSVAAILLTQAGLLAYSATRHSPTMLEPAQLAAGLSNWQFGRFELFRVNPPLVRMIAAAPVLAVGCETDWSSFYDSPGARPEFAVGADLIAANGERSIWLFTIARWACIPLATLGGLFCFGWSRELWRSNLAGLLTLAMWCFDPNVLAHGELITTDAAAASFGVGAAYLFWRWLKRPTWSRAGAAGLVLGLAQLSKMSWLFLFGLWPVLFCLAWFTSRTRLNGRDRRRAEEAGGPTSSATGDPNGQTITEQGRPSPPAAAAAQLGAILVIALYILNLGYGFDGSFTRLGDYTFISRRLTGNDQSGTPGNRFISTWLAAVPAPLPKQYLLGLDTQQHDFEDYGQPSYLRGEWKDGGWWYYYLYGLWVKAPHGTQLLFLTAVALCLVDLFRRQQRAEPVSDASPTEPALRETAVLPLHLTMSCLVLPPVILFVLVSAQLEFNHHLRYVLPCAGFAFVLIGRLARPWSRPALFAENGTR